VVVRLLARHRRLLAARIDLQERGAFLDAVARLHEDLRDLAVDLRLNRRRIEGLERGHVFGRVVERRQARAHDLHGSRRKALGHGGA
jgi:hypothetical protein